MRTITEKDKRGLLVALRTFIRPYTGERLGATAGAELVDKALDTGLTFDEIFNSFNYIRAIGTGQPPGAAAYIEKMCSRSVPVRPLKDEDGWYETDNGFAVLAEAMHDYFIEVTGRGGKWNTPTALTNLAKCIRAHSVQGILSETLFRDVCGEGDDALNWFNYIQAIARDFSSLPVDDSLTEAQAMREQETAEFLKNAGKVKDDEEDEESEESDSEKTPEEVPEYKDFDHDGPLDHDDPDLVPFPDREDGEYEDMPEREDDPSVDPDLSFKSLFYLQNNPWYHKHDCIRKALDNYSFNELADLVDTIANGKNQVLSEVVRHLADGRFDMQKETPAAKKIHEFLCADLMPSFIECVRSQGVEMDEELARKYDILHDSWDLRAPNVRKLHKLKKLILTFGEEDPDLEASIPDLDRFYANETD